jgi:hypothetical protein
VVLVHCVMIVNYSRGLCLLLLCYPLCVDIMIGVNKVCHVLETMVV